MVFKKSVPWGAYSTRPTLVQVPYDEQTQCFANSRWGHHRHLHQMCSPTAVVDQHCRGAGGHQDNPGTYYGMQQADGGGGGRDNISKLSPTKREHTV